MTVVHLDKFIKLVKDTGLKFKESAFLCIVQHWPTILGEFMYCKKLSCK